MKLLRQHLWAVVAAAAACATQQTTYAQVRVDAPRVNVDVNDRPWFSSPNIRRQLKIDDRQYEQLNRGYTQNWNRYNQDLQGLDRNLTAAQRLQRTNELYGRFNNDFSRSRDEVLTDAELRRRYNQLHWQYQGYRAFDDPALQTKLQLNEEQRLAIQRYNNEANEQLRTLRQEYGTNREQAAQRFNEWRKQVNVRINSTLNPQQRQTWTEMIGDPYDYNADDYFGTPNNASQRSP